VNATADVVQEAANAGIDSVLAQVNGYTMTANVEWLILDSTITNGNGNSAANTLVGNSVNNTLIGGGGNDSLFGGDGNDTLQGNTTYGLNEIDTLTGGGGNDLFALASASYIYYNDYNASLSGLADYALITDFTQGSDNLLLKSGQTYYLGSSGVAGVSGTGLYLETGATDELIAIIQSATTLDSSIITGALRV
jgi:Ca2+-binding RTX toxin-like protein